MWLAAGGILLVAGVVGFLAVQSLNDADAWASVLSAVVAVIGLVVSVVTAVGARAGRGRSEQTVADSTVGGGVRQVRGVAGSVRMRSSVPVPATPGSAAPGSGAPASGAPNPPATAEGQGDGDGDQVVERSHVSGSVDQVDQVGGDVEYGR